MNRYDRVYNCIWMVFGAAISALSLKLGLWGPSGPKDGLIPLLTGLSIFLVGILMFFRELSSRSSGYEEEFYWENREASKRLGSVLMGFCAMALFMPYLGFLLTSIAVMTVLVWLTERHRMLSAAITAVLACSLLYVFFSYVFEIRLPKGVLNF